MLVLSGKPARMINDKLSFVNCFDELNIARRLKMRPCEWFNLQHYTISIWANSVIEELLKLVLPNIIPAGSTRVFYLIRIGIFAFRGLSIFFFHFLIVVALLYYSKKKKQLRVPAVSVRVTCALAIATGIFIDCWAPIITMIAVDKWRRSPLHFWLQTLALSNSAMNFVIYSARMRDFKDAYVGIVRKMFCL